MSRTANVADLIDMWLSVLPEKHVSPHTVTNHRAAMRQFGEWLNAQPGLSDIHTLRVDTFSGYIKTLQDRKLRQTTLHAHIGILTRWLDYLVNHGLLVGGVPNRLGDIIAPRGVREALDRLVGKRPSLVAPRIPDLCELPNYYGDCARAFLQARAGSVPTEVEMLALRDYLTLLRNQALIGALFSSGGRIQEVLSLDVSQVLVRGHIVPAPMVVGKGRKHRPLRLDLDTQTWIKDYLRARRSYTALVQAQALFISHGPRSIGHRLTTMTGWRIVKTAAESLADQHTAVGAHHDTITDLLNVSPHSIRHFYAQALLDSGVDYKSIAAILGHSSTAITEQVYARMSDDQAIKTAETHAPRRAPRTPPIDREDLL